jgi:hypothetical protein
MASHPSDLRNNAGARRNRAAYTAISGFQLGVGVRQSKPSSDQP